MIDRSLSAWNHLSARARFLLAAGTLLSLAFALLLYVNRSATFYGDDWGVILFRRSWDLDAFLRPHVDQLSVLPVLILKTMLAVFGMSSYLPYRVVLIATHLGLVALLFAYARSRIGQPAALLVSMPMALLGFGYLNLFEAFQINYEIALSGGMLALLAVAKRRRVWDGVASLALLVGLASATILMPFVLGVALVCLLRPDRRSCWWVPVPALAAFAAWYGAYRNQMTLATLHKPLVDRIVDTPGFVAEAVSGAVGGLAGLGPVAALFGTGPGASAFTREGPASVPAGWGAPLAVLAVVLLVWQISRRPPQDSRQFTAIAAIAAIYWVALGMTRFFQTPIQSNYVYVGALLVILIGVEAMAGTRPTPVQLRTLAALSAVATVLNVVQLFNAANAVRDAGQAQRARLGALEIAGPNVSPGFATTVFLLPNGAEYVKAVRAFGSPAFSPEEIEGESETVQAFADDQLAKAEVKLSPSRPSPATGRPPVSTFLSDGHARQDGSCLVLRRDPAQPELDVRMRLRGDVAITVSGGDARLFLRRFADTFAFNALLDQVGGVPVQPGSSQVLRFAGDGLPRPWYLRVAAKSRSTTVCTLQMGDTRS